MTTTYSKRMTSERYAQYEYQAETRTIEQQHAQPWPVIHTVSEVHFRADCADPNNVIIDVIDSNSHITSRVRDAQAAIVEAVGYAARAGWNFSPVGELPDVFRDGFMALAEAMPVEVTA